MKSYPIVYQGDIATALNNIGITDFMILNDLLAVAYVADDFNGDILDNTYEVAWYQESKTMSTMIEINENIEGGERVATAAGTNFIEDNPYINLNGKDVLIGIIDSGIDYLHPDFINEDNTSKIISIWDQESEVKPPPEGMIFGSEFTRDDINQAISNNDDTLTKDNIGTGTIAAGIAVGNGRVNELYRGVALGSELIVVKLRQYEGTFKEGRINYINTDFLAGIKYILDIAKKEDKYLIINLTLGQRPRSLILTTLLNTFQEIRGNGVFVVSGAGNEGNTDVHYEGSLQGVDTFQDVILEVGEQKSLDITIALNDPGRVGVEVISPSGEISYKVEYAPDNEQYEGEYNLEDSPYEIRLIYPWLLSGNEELLIRIIDIKPGIWIIRLYPEITITGEVDIYLPNKNLIAEDTRFLDPNSYSTITFYGGTETVITIGAYNDKTNSMWIGSSRGPLKGRELIKPDIVAPGVDIIGPYINNNYAKATGTGVSSSLACGVMALIIEYINNQGTYASRALYTRVLKTYLMLGATKNTIYSYPNDTQGYGVLDLQRTIEAISNKL